MTDLTLGSLFDGSGGFPLAGIINGITPLWASEIEPFPIRVTTKRFPQMKHCSDISGLNGAELPPVDIITFGSPCTNLSTAGRREGLIEGEQSVLFFQAIRIIKEMREATNGKQPRFILWENVPGAFTSSGGADFARVLQEIVKIKSETYVVPMPPRRKWLPAGEIVGDGFSVAYRTIDAQYFGVPQRRRRIYLVADFAGECAADVLFERESVSWNTAPGKGEQQGASVNATKSVDSANGKPPSIIYGMAPKQLSHSISENISPTILANDYKDPNAVVYKVYGICAKESNSMKSANPHSGIYEADTSRTLDKNCGNPACNQGGMAVVSPTYCLEGNGSRPSHMGSGVNEGVAFTLNTVERHAVAYDCRNYAVNDEISGTIQAKNSGGHSDNYINPVVYSLDRAAYNQGKNAQFDISIQDDGTAQTVLAKGPGAVATASSEYAARRLVPLECCRLQGFPDYWCAELETPKPTKEDVIFWLGVFKTHNKITGAETKPKNRRAVIQWLRNPYSDGAEYKMWGNGVALPCAVFALAGIVILSQKINGEGGENV